MIHTRDTFKMERYIKFENNRMKKLYPSKYESKESWCSNLNMKQNEI